jgi:hypothetical protein
MRFGVAFVLALTIAVTACDRGRSVTTTAPTSLSGQSSNPRAQGISIAGTSSLARGSRAQLRSFARLLDGSYEEVTSQTLWSVDNPSVARIESEGWVTALTTGTSTISARFDTFESQLLMTVSGDQAGSGTGGSGSGGSGGSGSGGSGSGGSGSSSNGNGSSGGSGSSNPNPSDPCLPNPLPSDPPSPVPCPFPLPQP